MDNYIWQLVMFTGVGLIAQVWLKVRYKQFWPKYTVIEALN